jgi:hypothetical protein
MNEQTTEDAIRTVQSDAARLAHVLDMQGLAALLARVLYDRYVMASMVDKSGFPVFTEDQIFAIIVSGKASVEYVELGSSLTATVDGDASPSASNGSRDD